MGLGLPAEDGSTPAWRYESPAGCGYGMGPCMARGDTAPEADGTDHEGSEYRGGDVSGDEDDADELVDDEEAELGSDGAVVGWKGLASAENLGRGEAGSGMMWCVAIRGSSAAAMGARGARGARGPRFRDMGPGPLCLSLRSSVSSSCMPLAWSCQ